MKKLLLISMCLLGVLFPTMSQMSLKDILAKNARPLIEPYRDEVTGLYGYKNTKTDKIVIPCKYAFATAWSEGYGAVNVGGTTRFDNDYLMDYVCKGGKWGYVDSTGTMVIPAKYTSADEFHEGFSAVEMNGKKALIDNKGKVLTEFIYDYVFPVSEGVAVVGKGKPLRYGYIDTTGKVVIDFEFEEANSFFKGQAKVKKYGAFFSINKKGYRVE